MPQKVEYWEFRNITTRLGLEEYFHDRGKNHPNRYYHYTSLENIEHIFKDKRFRISNVSRFNDKIDCMQFGEPINLYYSLCFSVGKRENLPLWYLYSGVDGRGGRLGFTSSAIRELCDSAIFTLCEYDYDNPTTEFPTIPLKPSVDFELNIRDVLYANFDNEEHTSELRYSNLVNNIISSEEVRKYLAAHPGFWKSLIWSYEKETRLNIKLLGDKARLVTADAKKKYAIFMEIPSVIWSRMTLDLAPENDDMDKVLQEYPYINKFQKENKAVAYSKHKGEIKMKLHSENKKTNQDKEEK